MTMIARTVDGLPLVGTMQESEEVGEFFLWINHLLLIKVSSSVGEERPGIPESGEDAVSKAWPQLASSMYTRNWSIFIPVSDRFPFTQFTFTALMTSQFSAILLRTKFVI